MKRMVTVTSAVSLVLVACASSGTTLPSAQPSAPSAASPAVDTAPRVVTPPRAIPRNALLPRRTQEQRYTVENVARIERDSAGRKESTELRTRALVSFSIERDSLQTRGIGVVDSFTVRGFEGIGGNASPPMPPMNVPFEFSIDSLQVRVAVRPALSNLCDAPETGATNLVRDLLVRLPRQLDAGATWRDSSASFVCRAGVPITLRTRSSYVVDRIEPRDQSVDVYITRTMEIALDGSSTVAWRARSVRGSGTGTQNIRIDGRTGALIELQGQSTLMLDVGSDRIRQETRTWVR